MTSLEVPTATRVAPVVWLVLFSSFWIKCAVYFSIPFLTIFLSKHTTLSLPVIGLLVGLQPLANAIGGFLGGHLSDRIGRRTIVLISLAGTSLAYLGFFLVAQYAIARPSAPWLFAILNLLAGWFASFFWPVTQALISDVTTNEQRRRIYRHRYVIANIGAAVGPLIAVYLGFASASTAFLATAFFYGLLLAMFFPMLMSIKTQARTSTVKPEKRSLKQSLHVLAEDRALRYLLFAAILFGISYAQIESNLSQFVYRNFEDGVKFFSYLITINASCVLLLQPLSHLVEKRMTARAQTILGTVVFCLGCMIMALLPDTKASIILGIFVITLGEVLVVPTLSVLIDEIAPAHLRGTYFGAAVFRQLGPAFGPALGGLALMQIGAFGLFAFMAIVAALSIIFIRLSNSQVAA